MRVIRDRKTKRMRAMWDPHPMETRPSELAPDEEYVELAHMNSETAFLAARAKCGGQPGEIYVFDNRVEADPPELTGATPLTDALRARRKERGIPEHAPLTLSELADVEKGHRG